MWILSPAQKELEERVRTASVFITALGVLGAALYFLRPALLPLVLAVALKHLLQPVINVLSVRPVVCCGRTLLARPLVQGTRPRQGKRLQAACDYACRLQLPRGTAIVVALLLSLMVLGLLAAIVAESVHVFAERADVYARQVKVLLGRVLGWVEYFSCSWVRGGHRGSYTTRAARRPATPLTCRVRCATPRADAQGMPWQRDRRRQRHWKRDGQHRRPHRQRA